MRKRFERQSGGESLAAPPNTPPQTLPLQPWEAEFAEWLVTQPKRPTLAAQLAKAHEMIVAVGQDVNLFKQKNLRQLKAREAFKGYVADMQLSAVKKARAKLEVRLPDYVEAHRVGLTMAMEARDHRSIPNYTNPILDRVWPKQDQQIAQAAVVIELSPKQLASIHAPPTDVIVEELTDDDE